MVTIYNTTLSATSQRHFSDGLGGGDYASVIENRQKKAETTGMIKKKRKFDELNA